jgi:mono/diheme cytochrome c family protein
MLPVAGRSVGGRYYHGAAADLVRRRRKRMSKRPLVIFVIFAAICLVALPAWALTQKGSSDASAAGTVPAGQRQGLELFQINCGACHTLAAAGTEGIIGPNLDQLLGTGPKSADTVKANQSRVLSAIQTGIGGRMPKGILQGEQAKAVAEFVADNLSYIGP